ncbi:MULTISPECIES: PLP-dependent aminotransferase family protein [Actinomadura]|uniref:PLP-dependent aminotransferase family protein n=1 Tax=Actinomadura yumaensis TaxID=111807 RepID=A0ABW2CT31_9ACTN|nr:PLP-dependent aminotransferase family protein [Actinomadura sp. J1-007]MWK37353.1 aminotransferase class I/II-fold pyridoxal phosphate-dependent enzyme [Actinomadura sp. J1-007]
MAIEWAGSSPELLLRLERGAAEPLKAQLERGLRDAICSGRLQADERLPSSRELARQLGISRGLVQDCYGQLHAEGYLCTRAGSATRVAPLNVRDAPTATPTSRPSSTPGLPASASMSEAAARLRIDFAAGVPDLGSFPRGDWCWAQREVARTVPNAELGYGDPRGSGAFREVVAGYLRRVRAAVAQPERIVACTGFGQGLGIVLRVLVRRGVRRVAFEDPGYGDGATRAAVERAGIEAVPVPVDEHGVVVDALAGVGAVVVTPAHQWPTGVVLAPERRRALVAWAQAEDAVVIEDDYDAEFRYDREPVGSLQGLDPDRVIALGTVSKSLAPAVRLGWILCPAWALDEIAEDKRVDDRGSPVFDQLAVAALIESGRYGRHLRHMRAVYAKRRAALVAALAEHAPGVRLTGLDAGFHAVAHLPSTRREAEREVVEAARERSVGLYGMSEFRADRAATPPQLVLGFGNLGEGPIREGIAQLGAVLRPHP